MIIETLLATIQTADIKLFTDTDTGKEIVRFTADMDVDADGSGGNPFHDPDFQPDTRLHFKSRPLHAEVIPYVVVPPIVLSGTKGKVMGAHCIVTNTVNGKKSTAVVGDSGPTRKVGEGSPALCEALGLDPNPNHGGTSDHIIEYEIFVNQPATVVIEYNLQSA